ESGRLPDILGVRWSSSASDSPITGVRWDDSRHRNRPDRRLGSATTGASNESTPSYHHDYGVGIPGTRREGHRVGSPSLPAQAIRCGPASANYGSMVLTCMSRIP